VRLLTSSGQEIHGHEFHYWDSENCGSGFKAVKESSGKQWDCVHAKENMYAGFPHLYFYANLSAALRFIEACHKYGGNNDI
jgi:cobyrinic acid a,c-diamide synthase